MRKPLFFSQLTTERDGTAWQGLGFTWAKLLSSAEENIDREGESPEELERGINHLTLK